MPGTETLLTDQTLVADKAAPAADSGAGVVVTVEQQREFLVKAGGKADEIAKLDEAGLKAKYGEAKTAADKAAAASKGAPEKYEPFTMPQGVELDAEMATGLQAIAKELNLTQEQVQKLADLGAQQAQRTDAKSKADLTAAVQQWQKDARADKELGGGEGFDKNMAVAKRGMKELFSEEGVKLLRESGLGNHPEFIRACFKAGALFKNDTTEGGQQRGTTSGTTFSYPNSKHA